MLGTVPPVPVAALGDQQLLVSQFSSLLRSLWRRIIGLSRAQQILPGFVVLLSADPDIEISADPGGGKDVIDRLGHAAVKSFGDRKGLHVCLVLNPPVQFTKEGPPVPVVVFPGILSIEDDRDQRVAAARQDARAVLADAGQEVV